MSETEQHAPGPMDSLIADFRVSMKRLKEHPPESIEDITKELRLNVYPSLVALAEEVAEVDEVVLEMSNQQDSYIQAELAAQIFQTIAIGGQLLKEIRGLLSSMSDLTAKRVKGMLDGFEHSMELTMMGVAEATLPGDEDEDPENPEDPEDDEDKKEEEEIIVPDLPDTIAAEGDNTDV